MRKGLLCTKIGAYGLIDIYGMKYTFKGSQYNEIIPDD